LGNFIIIIILFVHKNNFIKTRQPTTRERGHTRR